jgi:hypothetical protein
MRLPKYDHMIETFTSDRADESLRVPILPRRARRNGVISKDETREIKKLFENDERKLATMLRSRKDDAGRKAFGCCLLDEGMQFAGSAAIRHPPSGRQ